jgi:uncharacterized protein (TIGR03083 family)
VTDAIDYAGAYHDLRVHVTALLRDTEPSELEKVAPATPAWRVRDVLAHIAGVCDDVSNGNLAGVATDEWTDAQVAKRRAWSLEKLLDDWEANATTIEASMNDLGPAIGQMLADAVTHEQDIRGALGVPGGRESPALVIGVDWALGILGLRIAQENRGSLRVEHEVGTTEVGDGDPVTTLRASRFEVGRALTGRRSRAQMRAMDWEGPFEPEALVLAPTIFTPPAADLVE